MEKVTRDDSPIRVSTQSVAKAQAAQAMKLAPHQAKQGDQDAKPEGGVYSRKDKSSLSDEEMDDNSAFQLELSHEERNLEDKEMEMSDLTLCEAAAQTEEAAAKAARNAMTPTGAGEGNMPPPTTAKLQGAASSWIPPQPIGQLRGLRSRHRRDYSHHC